MDVVPPVKIVPFKSIAGVEAALAAESINCVVVPSVPVPLVVNEHPVPQTSAALFVPPETDEKGIAGRSPATIALMLHTPATAVANMACVVVVSVEVCGQTELSALLVQRCTMFKVVSRPIVLFTFAVKPAASGISIVAAVKSCRKAP